MSNKTKTATDVVFEAIVETIKKERNDLPSLKENEDLWHKAEGMAKEIGPLYEEVQDASINEQEFINGVYWFYDNYVRSKKDLIIEQGTCKLCGGTGKIEDSDEIEKFNQIKTLPETEDGENNGCPKCNAGRSTIFVQRTVPKNQ